MKFGREPVQTGDRAKITLDPMGLDHLLTITAQVAEQPTDYPNEETMRQVRENMEKFTVDTWSSSFARAK